MPRARFLAVGQGPQEAEVVAQHAELGLGDRFQLLGYRSDVMDVLSACDVFALASLHEGFPIALMEAMAMGVPLVATSVGGVPDAVVDGVNGLVVEPGRPDDLAAALVRMTSDDELRARCAAATLGARDAFDIRTAVRTIEQRLRGAVVRAAVTCTRRPRPAAAAPSRRRRPSRPYVAAQCARAALPQGSRHSSACAAPQPATSGSAPSTTRPVRPSRTTSEV